MTDALNEPPSCKVVERIPRGSASVHTLSSAHLGCLGINGALACPDDAESIRRECVRRRAASQQALRQRLERAQREEDLLATADSATLASFVMAVSQGMAVQAKGGASRKALERMADYVLSI
ncbi:hypothetical protein [Caballeronia sp. GAFFF2]|uniref:TetR family transcriptional regulator C-terminal domain-containing protein n=1 Tax=Caballeronia sp. GAFFF2 TaxID=2921741 RepID=UPI002028DB4D|nr:hypothetical protein [Caballeronia sp. GAFFF2]